MRPRRRPEDRTRPQPQDRINDAIRVPQVRLVGEDGADRDQVDERALEYAYAKGLDLVEVAAQADPPVARVMDYGKYRYEQEQKAKLAGSTRPRSTSRRSSSGRRSASTTRRRRATSCASSTSARRSRSRSCSGGREPASGAGPRPAAPSRRRDQGRRAGRVAAAPRRAEHGDAARPHEKRRSADRCQR